MHTDILWKISFFQIEIRKILANVFNSAALEEEEEASDSQRNIFGNVTSEDDKKGLLVSIDFAWS